MADSERDLNYHPFAALADLKRSLLAKQAKVMPPVIKKSKSSKSVSAQNLASDPPPLKPPPPPEPDEATLFLREMADVAPLKKPTKRLAADPPNPKTFKRPLFPDEDLMVLESLTDLVSGRAEFDLTYSDEYVEGRLKGLPAKCWEELKLGRVQYEDYIDLHGLTLTQAEAAIVDFVLRSVSLRRRCLLLVHGRGNRSVNGVPVLKHNLEYLLLRRPIKRHILAFTTALPIDGGLGASYVLLRR